MEYNTQRKQLIVPEYGRCIQEMIQVAINIEDRESRNKAAREIIRQMAQMQQGSIKDAEDLEIKLWDHLIIMSDYQLDVDSPYPAPDKKEEKEYSRLRYNSEQKEVPYRYYGTIITEMIQKTVLMPDGEEKDALVHDIANNMKKLYVTWNKGSVDDSVIFGHLTELSGGKLSIDSEKELTNSWTFLNNSKPPKKKIKNFKQAPRNFQKRNNRQNG